MRHREPQRPRSAGLRARSRSLPPSGCGCRQNIASTRTWGTRERWQQGRCGAARVCGALQTRRSAALRRAPAPPARGPPSPQQVAFTQRVWRHAEHRKHEHLGDEKAKSAGTLAVPPIRGALRTRRSAALLRAPVPQARGPPSPQQVASTQRVWRQAEHRKHEHLGDEKAKSAGTLGVPPICGALRTPRSAALLRAPAPQARGPPSPQQVALTQRVWRQAEHRKHEHLGDERAKSAGTLAVPRVCGALRTRRSALRRAPAPPARGPPSPQQVAFTQRVWRHAEHRKHEHLGDARVRIQKKNLYVVPASAV